MSEKSEFGKGLVVCLSKFYQHFGNDMLTKASFCKRISEMSEEDQEKVMSDKPPPNLNYGKDLNEWFKFWKTKLVPIYGSIEAKISSDITLWANGASDHLYEIEVPKDDPIDEAFFLYFNMLRKILRKILNLIPHAKVKRLIVKLHNFIPVEGVGWFYIREIVEALQDKGLEMGHGAGLMGSRSYTFDDLEEISGLTEKALILVDIKLGLRPDWGSF